MLHLEWKKEFSVGCVRLDDDHRQLISLFNQLMSGLEEGVETSELSSSFETLIWYTRSHFVAEEKLMKECGFPDLESHKREHDDFTVRMLQLFDELSSRKGLAVEVVEMLREWITTHILYSDSRYAHFIRNSDSQTADGVSSALEEREKRLLEMEHLGRELSNILETITRKRPLNAVMQKLVALTKRYAGRDAAIFLINDHVPELLATSTEIDDPILLQQLGSFGSGVAGRLLNHASLNLGATVALRDEYGVPLGGVLLIGCVSETTSQQWDLLRRVARVASIALHHQKSQKKRPTIEQYDDMTETRVYSGKPKSGLLQQSLAIETQLSGAIERGEVYLVYQPQVNLAGRVVGFEALLRWRNPELGNVPPSLFIPIAESTGFNTEIDKWVIREAFGQAARWAQIGSRTRMSINVSANGLMNAELIDHVKHLLDVTGVDPSLIELEITETAVMEKLKDAADRIRSLRSLGVRVAIDDFGVGYSSLSYLRLLPVDCVKIDRSFLRGIDSSTGSMSILKAVIKLIHELKLEAIVEGVETQSELQLVAPLNPDLLQGYYFYAPMAVEQAETLIAPLGAHAFIQSMSSINSPTLRM